MNHGQQRKRSHCVKLGEGGAIRGYDTVDVKWKNSIRPKVVAFSVVYDSVQRMDENGSSDLVLFQNALAEFQTGYGHPFTMKASDEHEICHGYLTEKEHQQLLLDEEALRETLEEEARPEKERARTEKEWEEIMKEEQVHDELFRLKFEVKSDLEYESD
nr:hypothetical protein [Tanacetum cinerariifolium]